MSAAYWFWMTAVCLLVSIFPTVVAVALDARTLDGERVWSKPLKFELSLCIHFITLAWLAGYLADDVQGGALANITAIAAALATLFEIGYMSVQAIRGKRSHFNVGTPVEATLYSLMAVGAVLITAAAAVVGLLLLTSQTPAAGAGLKLGGGFGLTMGALLTMVTAFRIGAAMSRYNGTERPGGRRMPLTGWSMTAADRRIPHFFATHLMQALPVFGWACDIIFESFVSLWLVVTFGALYTVFTLLLFRAINRGDVISLERLSL